MKKKILNLCGLYGKLLFDIFSFVLIKLKDTPTLEYYNIFEKWVVAIYN